MLNPVVNALIESAMQSVGELRGRVSGVKYAPLETYDDCILFNVDATPYIGALRGRNRNICIMGDGRESDSAAALRVLLDGDAYEVTSC